MQQIERRKSSTYKRIKEMMPKCPRCGGRDTVFTGYSVSGTDRNNVLQEGDELFCRKCEYLFWW